MCVLSLFSSSSSSRANQATPPWQPSAECKTSTDGAEWSGAVGALQDQLWERGFVCTSERDAGRVCWLAELQEKSVEKGVYEEENTDSTHAFLREEEVKHR